MLDQKQTLLDLNQEGIIPGPLETETDFFRRAEYCLQLKKKLEEETGTSFDEKSSSFFEEVYPVTQKYYDLRPSWIPLLFDNHKLSLWHGGCAWIFQMELETPISAFIQLRKQLKNHQKWAGILNRKEILSHEIAHVGRMAFDEPKYEEMLAYASSTSFCRSYFGAIVKSSKESALFVLTLFLIFLLDLFLLFKGEISFFYQMMPLKLIPLLTASYALGRLFLRRRKFSSCLQNLQIVCGSKAFPALYRLTDKEIDLFSSYSPNQIKEYANLETSLRWKVISSYFKI